MKIIGNKIILSIVLISLLFISGFTDAINTGYDDSLKSNLNINKGVKSIEKISDKNIITPNDSEDIKIIEQPNIEIPIIPEEDVIEDEEPRRDEPIEVNNCQTLDEEGEYVLQGDIETDERVCFRINEAGITLDLNGHKITGDGDGAGINVNDGSNFCIIKNGEISNFAIGIDLEDSDSCIIIDNKVNENDYGILLEESSNSNNINSNIFCYNNDFDIFIEDGENNEFLYNQFDMIEGLELDGMPCDIEEQEIQLNPGWNLISSYLVPYYTDIEAIFGPLARKGDLMMAKDSQGRFWIPERNFNNMNEWNPYEGYLVKVGGATTLIIKGGEHISPIIELHEGWNTIAYPLTEESDMDDIIENVLSPLVEDNILDIIKNWRGNYYVPEWNFNNIDEMNPGQGYQIRVTEDTVIDFSQVFPQVPEIIWSQTYGGENDEESFSMILTNDGKYAVGGITNSFGEGEEDFYLIKINEDGELLWSNTYGGRDVDQADSIIQTNDNGYAVCGTTSSFGNGRFDFYLVKTDEDGEQEWAHSDYEGAGYNHCLSIIQTPNGGYSMAGKVDGNRWDSRLIQTDERGDELWSRSYHREWSEAAVSHIRTENGDFVLAGYANIPNQDVWDIWIVKTDEEGNEIWSESYGGDNSDLGMAILETNDGKYAVGGITNSFGEGEEDFYLIKINEDGELLWSNTYGGENNDRAYSIIQVEDGGFVLAGSTESFGEGGKDCYVVRTNDEGEEIWSLTYGGEENDLCTSVVSTPDGGYALGGSTESFGEGGRDFWLIKLGSEH